MERSGTVTKAVRVLEALHERGGSATLAELASAVRMPKPTLHRLLSSLSGHELVEQGADGRYGLGIGLVRLGLGALAMDPLVRVARRELEQAARAFGETFFLVSARAGRLFVLDKVEGTGLLRAAPSVGAEVPVEVTASGRLYLGLAPSALSEPVRGKHAAQASVQRAIARGYDTNEGEWIAGLTVIAAPVVVRGALLGTIACGGSALQLEGERLREAIDHTVRVAKRTSQALEGRRGEPS